MDDDLQKAIRAENDMREYLTGIESDIDILKIKEGLYLIHESLTATMNLVDTLVKTSEALRNGLNTLSEIQKSSDKKLNLVADAMKLVPTVIQNQQRIEDQHEKITTLLVRFLDKELPALLEKQKNIEKQNSQSRLALASACKIFK